MPNGDTTPGPTPTQGTTSPPKPTPADLRKSADQMREMAKATQQRASEARSEEKRLEGQADEADREMQRSYAEARRAVVERDTAVGRAEAWKKAAADEDREGDAFRKQATSLVEEAEKVEATDPAKAADLREKADRWQRLAAEKEQKEQEAREAEATARAEARTWDERSKAHEARFADVRERMQQLRRESERWEEKADELEAIAKSQADQAGALDASAVNLEIETGVRPPDAGAMLDQPGDAADEVLASLDGGADREAVLEAQNDPATGDGELDPTPLMDDAVGVTDVTTLDEVDEPLDFGMPEDEVATASAVEDEGDLGSDFSESQALDATLPEEDAAPADDMGEVEV